MKSTILTLLLLLLAILGYAQQPPAADSAYFAQHFTKHEYRIAMRDGAHLYTTVYMPRDTSRSYPILYCRTPYGVGPYGEQHYRWRDMHWYRELLQDGYIWVYQDVRGRFMSEGQFTNMTPYIAHKKKPQQVDESSDVYDTVDWLMKNLRGHNQRVGVLGISYRGFYSTCAAIDAHPAVKCVSPQAPMADVWYDDFRHNGAFLLSYLTSYPVFGEHCPAPTPDVWWQAVQLPTPDLYDYGLRMGNMEAIDSAQFRGRNFFWREMMEHPNYDSFWQSRNILPHLKDIKPAVLTIGGLYDAEDLYGSWNTYKAIEKLSPKADNRIVMGPWVHGGWARTPGRSLGNIYFGEGHADYYRTRISKPFFDYYLKDKGPLALPEALVFDCGANRWREFAAWPPTASASRKLFLQPRGGLAWQAPGSATSSTSYVSDPAKPVPYTEATATGLTQEYMTDDQRFAARRPDVLVFQTEPLTDSLTLTGEIKVRLYVESTGTDADWVVKLINVYPDSAAPQPHQPAKPMGGYQRMVRSEVCRSRWRNSTEKPEPLVPGRIAEISLSLQDVCHTFAPGHRLMIQVQSSWFPMIDRNPQTFVENIYTAPPMAYKVQTHTVHHSTRAPSYIEVQVLKR